MYAPPCYQGFLLDLICCQGLEQLLTGLLTPTARLGADPAVLMHPGMLLAFYSAQIAGSGTSFDLQATHQPFRFGLTRENLTGSQTYIRAIKVEPDAASQFLNHLLSEAGVGTHTADLHALVTGMDAVYKPVQIGLLPPGMSLNHFLYAIHGYSFHRL